MSTSSSDSSGWQQLSRKFMICNPFLILSPLFLLQGIHQAVKNPNLFTTDLSNTLFLFAALLVYLTLLGVISTRLGQKTILADAALLLSIQSVLFLAPFILIAHGVFLQSGVALSLGISGWMAGMGQLLHLKRRLPCSFVSAPLLFGAGMVLAVAVALPMVFRQGLENAGNDNGVWGRLSPYAWHLLLPLLVLWLNLLPGTVSAQPIWSRTWFSPAVFLTWVMGIGLQLWTLAYVDDQAMRGFELTLPLWVLAWTCFRRVDLLPSQAVLPVRKWVPSLSVLIPAAGSLLGMVAPVACLTFGINAVVLARLRINDRRPWKSFAASIAGVGLTLPQPWLLLVENWVWTPLRTCWDLVQSTPSGLVPILLAFGLLLAGFRHACRRGRHAVDPS